MLDLRDIPIPLGHRIGQQLIRETFLESQPWNFLVIEEVSSYSSPNSGLSLENTKIELPICTPVTMNTYLLFSIVSKLFY